MIGTRRAALAGLALACVCAAGDLAGATGVTYYLRQGSTAQEGCNGECACLLLPPEPLRGVFTLTQSTPHPVYQNFTFDNILLRAPTLSQQFAGSGTYQIVTDSPGQEQIELTMSINGEAPMQWFGGRRAFSMPTPVIQTSASLPGSCFDIALIIRATPFKSDWNADGSIAMDDVFDFLTAWLAGDGDTNNDGQSVVADIFEFINAWMSGV